MKAMFSFILGFMHYLLHCVKSAVECFMRFSMLCVRSPRFATVMMLALMTTYVMAQSTTGDYSTGITAIQDVSSNIKSYIPYVRQLIFAIAGVVGIAGLISTYWEMQNDGQDVKKRLMMTIGSCIFLIAAGIALPKFFGMDN